MFARRPDDNILTQARGVIYRRKNCQEVMREAIERYGDIIEVINILEIIHK